MGGDVDAAVEVLVAEQGSSDQIIAEDGSSSLEKTSYGNDWQLCLQLFCLVIL